MSRKTRSAERSGVAALLRRALTLVRETGWRSGHWDRQQHEKGLSLTAAVQRAGEGGLACYYARIHLTTVLGFPYIAWEENPWRTEAEVLFFLRRAIAVAEGKAFARRAGGWRISSGPPLKARAENVASLSEKQRKGGAR